MSASKDHDADDAVTGEVAVDESQETPQKLNLTVDIAQKSACQRHLTVTVAREDIDRYFDKSFSDLMGKAEVPGFRAGRAPRKLVESRFRKDIADQVKLSLLMDSMSQVSEDQKLSPISEPEFDPVAVKIPDEGPMTFEFDIEVRPEFDLPNWKGLSVERPVHEFTAEEIDQQLKDLLGRRGRLVPHDGPAAAGDYVVVNLTFEHDGQSISSAKEETIRIRPVLSFRDGKVEGFEKLMKGVKANETREGKAKLTQDAPNEALRGKTIKAIFEVLEVKKLELPEVTPALLDELGGFTSEAELREAIKDSLARRLQYQQQRRARDQVLAALTVAAHWDLPPELLHRQSGRELQRSVLELQRSGFSDAEIRAHENELRQNSRAATARALKEHFVLERIAEEEKIEETAEDYDLEIALIAQQTGESPRRVRAQLEKRGMMDTLRNQIIERKAIDLILSHAKFNDVPYKPDTTDAEAVDQTVSGTEEEADIPEAKHAGGAEGLRQPQDHT
ncbi:MAG: trigger factor [Planctomycetia bacterium]|nr:trigger factor [Planctomycetia bacterium]